MKYLMHISSIVLVLGIITISVVAVSAAAAPITTDANGINITVPGPAQVTVSPAPSPQRRSGEVEMPVTHPIRPLHRETTSQPTVSASRTPQTPRTTPSPTIPQTTVTIPRTTTPTTVPVTRTPTTVPVTPTVPQTTKTVTRTPTIPVVTVTVLVYPSGPVYLPTYYYPPGYSYPITSYYPTGSLTVTSDPSEAVVILDGYNSGTTPYIFTGLAPGYHTVEVDYPGYEAYITNVYLDNGANNEIDANLVSLVNYGSMFVDSTPEGADVYVDGNYEGTSPVTVSSLSEGIHQVELHRAGYEVYTSTEDVTGGQGTVINPVMVPYSSSSGSGSIDITSNLPGSLVYLDGMYKGSTLSGQTFNVIAVGPGSHTILLHVPGYTDFTQSVEVNNGQISYVSAIFTQVPAAPQSPSAPSVSSGAAGSIVASSTPAGGQVYLDNQFRGVAPVTIYNVAPGTHIINMKLQGYSDWSTSVSVPAGQVTQVPATFAAGSSTTPVPTRAALSPFAILGALVTGVVAVSARIRR